MSNTVPDNDDVRSLTENLMSRVAEVRDARASVELMRRLVISGGAVAFSAFILLTAEAVGYMPSVIRTILVGAFVIGVLPAALAYVVPPLLRRLRVWRGEEIARTAHVIGMHFPEVRDRLLNILQLVRPGDHRSWVSSELIAESVRTLHRELNDIDLRAAVDRSGLRTAVRRAGAGTAIAMLAVLGWPSTFLGSYHRLAHYDEEFTPPRSYALTILPGDAEVAKGADVMFRLSVRPTDDSDDLPTRAHLFLRGEGQTRFESVELLAAAAGQFSHEISGIRYSQEYYASIGDERTDTYRIAVLDWPSLQSFRIRLDQPEYAGLPAIMQDEFAGDISALAGTRITLTGRASKNLAEGEIRFADSSTVSLDVSESAFRGSFTITRPGSYSVHVRDVQNLANRSPIPYQIRIAPDGPPVVAITQPGRNIDIAGGESVGLYVEATDDFGISALTLRYRLSHSKFVRPGETYESAVIPLPAGARRDIATSYMWSLESLDLVPEDVVEYFVEAYDNDTVNGPKSSRSQTFTLRLPSLEEVFADAETGHEQALENLDEAMRDAEQLRKDIEEISKDLKTNKEFDWQDQKKAEEMAKKAEDIQRRLETTEQQLKKMTDEMQRQQVLSTETLEKYLELQNLFQQMDTQELQQALRQMQQAMEGVRKDQLQQAMQQVEFSEERFRQGIERTLNLLKRIQIEQRMDEASKRAEELAAKQEELGQQSDGNADQRAKEQQDLAAEQQRLEDLLQDLQQRMEEFFTEMPADRLSELNEDLQQQQLQQQMTEAAQQLRDGKTQDAQRSQQQIQQSLESLTQQLQSMQQQMLQNQTDQILNALRRATTDLLELSQRQEQTRNDARSSPANSPSLRENAQRQMQLMRELSTIAENLSQLAQKSFAVTPEMGRSIGEAMQGMQNAMRDLEVRNGAQAAQDQTGSMASINKAAQQVQQSLETMMQGAQGSPGGMGLMQQLQMMAGQQMQLNAQTQRMGEGTGDAEAMRRAAEAARIAREQDAVRKSLEQLKQEAQTDADGDRILGDLDRIADDMREVVRNLEQNNVDDQTIRQQERILSRLLDASRSMREKDFEKRREAASGRRFTRRGPDALPIDETKNWLRQEMLRALEKGYSRDYQELIRRYFEELERATAESD